MAFDPVYVSAADGPLHPTVEQLKALKAQGATTVDVVLTHTDLVDDAELLELVELEVRDLAAQNGLDVGSFTRGTAGPDGAVTGPDGGPTVPYGPPS